MEVGHRLPISFCIVMDQKVEKVYQAAEYIKGRIGGERQPVVGIVLGSGLGKLAEGIENATVIPYSEIPHFPVSTAIGHKGNFIAGMLGGKFVVAMQGRFHYYEGYTMEYVTLPIRVMKVLGIKNLFISNAAGGVNFDFKVGDLMVIKDHINLLPNPLLGPNIDEFGPRFSDMTRPYEPALIAKAEELAAKGGITLRKGVYLGSQGPSYETPAEYKYFRTIGADAVGFSTTPEVIVARHSSIPVFGVSVITNVAHDEYAPEYVNDGDDVVMQANAASEKMSWLFTELIKNL